MDGSLPADSGDATTFINCSTSIPVSNTTFTWAIENIHFSKLYLGGSLNSPFFSVGLYNWYLLLKMESNNVGLYIGCTSNTIAKYRLYIINNKNEEKLMFSETTEFKQGVIIGKNGLITKSALFAQDGEYLTNGTLRLCCELNVAGSRKDLMSTCNYGRKVTKLSEELYDLFITSRFSDVTIIVDKTEFKVHKLILSARSSVFAAMLEHDMLEKTSNTIRITDSSPEAMKAVLSFIYSGSCKEVKGMAAEILPVADKYALLELKDLCEETLISNLDLNNFSFYLKLSEMHSLGRLKAGAIDYFTKNGHNLLRNDEWKNMMESNPQIVVELLSKKMEHMFS